LREWITSDFTTAVRLFVSFGSLWYTKLSLDTKEDGVEDHGRNRSRCGGIMAKEHPVEFRADD
jgi:hypothetical protein